MSAGFMDAIPLAPGDRLPGPAILTEPTTTTYLDADHTAEVHPTGALIIT